LLVDLNNASFGGVPPDNAKYASNFGVGFGGVVELRVHKDVVLSLQPTWLQKGSKVVFNEDEEPDSVETFVVEQTYVSVPLLFRIESDGRGFYAGGGVSVDLLLDSEVEHDGTTVDNSGVFDDIDVVSYFTVGYLIPSKRFTTFIEGRYVQGLVNINSGNQTAVGDMYVADFKSTGIALVAGVLFSL
jgi:hypothetical protein